MDKVDKKDEKILIELIKNSRTPVKQLAKKVGVSREVANYRINQLVKKKIIKKFYTEINEKSLEFKRVGCIVQLKGISEKEEKEFINLTAKNKHVTYLGPIIGKWNFAFDIIIKSEEELEKILMEIFSDYKDKIRKYIINSPPIESEFFSAKIFVSVFEEKIRKTKEIALTKKDFEILKLLRDNSRIEYSELAKKLNITGNAIKHRIKKLENSGIIDSYTIAIDYWKLGFEFYNLQIKFLDYDFRALKEFLIKNKSVKYFYRHLGNENWDLYIGLIVRNSEELRELLIKLREYFGEKIEIHDLYIVPEETKENILPDVVFE